MKNKVSITGEKKVLCKECGDYFHPAKYEVCFNCWSKKPQNNVKPSNAEGYQSMKDYQESQS